MPKHEGTTITLSKSKHIINLKSGYTCGQLVIHEKDGKVCYCIDKKIKIFGNCNNDARVEIYQKDFKLGIHSCWKHEEKNINNLIKILKEKIKKNKEVDKNEH